MGDQHAAGQGGASWGRRLRDTLARLLSCRRPKGELTVSLHYITVRGVHCAGAVEVQWVLCPGIRPGDPFMRKQRWHRRPFAPAAADRRLRRAHARRYLCHYQATKLSQREMRLQKALSQRELTLAKSGGGLYF